jgi:hypothetical protein
VSFNNKPKNRNQIWDAIFGSAECVKNYYFYSYEYIDESGFMQDAADIFKGWPPAEELLDSVYREFEKLGCSGGGRFQVIWLPSFVGANTSNNYGHYILHYKQFEDGISWLASPCVLPFHRLFQGDSAESRRPNPKDVLTEIGEMMAKDVEPKWPNQFLD